MDQPECHIGRVRTALVSHLAGGPVAVPSAIHARLLPRRTRRRLAMSGPVSFTTNTKRHLEDTIVPAVDRITNALDRPARSFDLSVVNLSVAAVRDLGMQIEGFSLDAAAALAMLSASLRLPIRQDTVVTGHLASANGEIRPVRSLQEKLAAVASASDIRQFLYPSLDEDSSLETLAPGQREELVAAIATASSRIRSIAIGHMGDVLRGATTDLGRLQAALSSGHFAHHTEEELPTAAAILVDGLEESFWRLLEADLYGARLRSVKRLLELRVRHELRRKRYPQGFGVRLSALVRSVTPTIRRRRGFFPLLPAARCFEIGAVASTRDQHDDAATLVGAALGRFDVVTGRSNRTTSPRSATPTASCTLDATLDAISAERLAEEIGIPADEARGAFVLPGVVVDDYDLFNDTVTAFHLALLRHTDGGEATPQPDNALALLESAYADAGGMAAARSEAKFAVRGGMRRILDLMTERFKNEQRFKRVNRVLKESLDPLDWDRQVTFMSALLARLRPHLPDELCRADPARYVRRRDEIVRVYVDALDRVQDLMRTL